MRGLSNEFMASLKNGLLKPILERIKKDDTLMLAIRGGYINIYYRGGNLIKITEQPTSFELYFDQKYDLSENRSTFHLLNLPKRITEHIQVAKWISSIAVLKELMDFWFIENPRLEREAQQLVERENNRSSISGITEYFITDIEYADSLNSSKFDITAIKWPAKGRTNSRNCRASFIEMKYGDEQLTGTSGLIKHIADINRFLSNRMNYSKILEEMTTQFNQFDELGLLKFNHPQNNTVVRLSDFNKPEFIFLLANHNPRSPKLKRILSSPEFKKHIHSDNFNLRFYVNSDAGYALHIDNMLTYDEYMIRFT